MYTNWEKGCDVQHRVNLCNIRECWKYTGWMLEVYRVNVGSIQGEYWKYTGWMLEVYRVNVGSVKGKGWFIQGECLI